MKIAIGADHAGFEVKEQLKNLGYEVNCIGRSTHIEQSEIVGYNTNISAEMIKLSIQILHLYLLK